MLCATCNHNHPDRPKRTNPNQTCETTGCKCEENPSERAGDVPHPRGQYRALPPAGEP